MLETYRAGLKNARINQELKQTKISMPILTIGAPEFFGELVEGQMLKVADKVDRPRSSTSAGTASPWKPRIGWPTSCASSCWDASGRQAIRIRKAWRC